MAPQTRSQSKIAKIVGTTTIEEKNTNQNTNSWNWNNQDWHWSWYVMMFMAMFAIIVWTSVEMANWYDYKPVINCVDYTKQYISGVNDTWWNNYYSYNFTALTA